MDFLQTIDWMQLIKCFSVGGGICVIGQILIDKTKLTPARILVAYVTIGVVLGGLGIYRYLIDFAGSGATVPLTGFGYNLINGTIEATKEHGLIGVFTGGLKASAGRNFSSSIFWIYCFFNFKTKNEKTIIVSFKQNGQMLNKKDRPQTKRTVPNKLH